MNTDLVWRMVRVFAVAGSVSYPGGEMPECRGQNARVLFGGDEITILREGLAAKLNFVDPHPWQIPVAALTGVDLQPPGPLHVGRLQFLIKGAPVHHGSTAELHEDPTIVFFTPSRRREFEELAADVEQRIAVNQQAGWTADMVELPPAPVSRSTVRRHATK